MSIWFFQKPVVLEGRRSVEDAERALNALARPPLSLGRILRRRPFVGRVEQGEGRLWMARRRGLSYPGRRLDFRLVPAAIGSRLEGQFRVTTPLLVFVGAYAIFAVVVTIWMMIESALHGGGALYLCWLAARMLLCVFGFCYGYIAIVVWVGGSAERLQVKLIQHTIDSEESAAVVADLLSST